MELTEAITETISSNASTLRDLDPVTPESIFTGTEFSSAIRSVVGMFACSISHHTFLNRDICLCGGRAVCMFVGGGGGCFY